MYRPTFSILGAVIGTLGAVIGTLGAVIGTLGAVIGTLEAVIGTLGAVIGTLGAVISNAMRRAARAERGTKTRKIVILLLFSVITRLFVAINC